MLATFILIHFLNDFIIYIIKNSFYLSSWT